MEENFYSEFKWVTKVVNSTQTLEQLDKSRNCYTNFLKKHHTYLNSNPRLFNIVSNDFNNLYYDQFLQLK
jgi:hypothetical protein